MSIVLCELLSIATIFNCVVLYSAMKDEARKWLQFLASTKGKAVASMLEIFSFH